MIVDALKCLKCNDVIWSRHRHDMRWCSCKTVAIDGGRDYTKILGNRENWELLKEYDTDAATQGEKS